MGNGRVCGLASSPAPKEQGPWPMEGTWVREGHWRLVRREDTLMGQSHGLGQLFQRNFQAHYKGFTL